MESVEGVAAKRRVLVDALTMCLQRSKVCETISPDTIRSVLATASTEIWREGEFRLEYVWKILCQQPGLSAKEVAPPLLVFKAYESELGVIVRVPQALSALPRGEQVRLRDELGITKADFAKAIGELQALAASEAAKEKAAQKSAPPSVPAPAEKPEETPSFAPAAKKGAAKNRRPLAIALASVAALAMGLSFFFTFRDTAQHALALPETASVLQLDDGVLQGESMMARISDARWDKWSKEEREKAALAAFEALSARRLKVLTLVDGQKRPRAMVTDLGGRRNANVYP